MAQPLHAEDGSSEVRAFAEDTGNVMGTTWPPTSYTCTFCPREFRSAQALGGHMNVHRRDRDRLRRMLPATAALMNPTSSISSTLLFPAQQLSGNGGLCPLYQSPNPNGFFASPTMRACSVNSPSTLLSIPPYPSVNLMAAATTAAPLINFPVTFPGLSNSSSLRYSTKAEPSTMSADHNLNDGNNTSGINFKETSIEEIDLELRLAHRPTNILMEKK